MEQRFKQKALVVDDEAAIRSLLASILQREGFAVECATDGFEAIEKLKEGSFDVILLDLMMPKIDGFGVLRFLRNHHPDLFERVLVMTAMPPGTIQVPVTVLNKPFELKTLVDLVRQILDRGSLLRHG